MRNSARLSLRRPWLYRPHTRTGSQRHYAIYSNMITNKSIIDPHACAGMYGVSGFFVRDLTAKEKIKQHRGLAERRCFRLP